MELPIRQGTSAGSFHFIGYALTVVSFALLCASCGAGGDGDTGPNSPVATPFALVVNQDETTLTTVRLDGKFSPVVSTLSLGPSAQDAIGGVAFSLGEWIFVTHTAGDRVAAIDPVGGPTPILEDFLTTNPANTLVRIGQRPTRIYRDPWDKEVLWTTNDGDPVTGIDTLAGCPKGGSVSVLHNSHLGVGGGDKPRVTSRVCLSGKGEHFVAFSRPPVEQNAFVSSKKTGVVSVLLPVPLSDGGVAWSEGPLLIDLCKRIFTRSIPPNCGAEPAGMFWSEETKKLYSYLSGLSQVVEIDMTTFVVIDPPIDISLSNTVWSFVGMTPDGKFLFFAGEDTQSDPARVIGTIGLIELTATTPTLTTFSVPELDNIRPAQFKFTPDGKRLYLLQSNSESGLQPDQISSLKRDKLLVFDSSTFPANPRFIKEIDLPSVGPDGMHGMDVWAAGPPGAGSAKVVVVTNAKPGVNGSVSLIDAANHKITANIPVGKNPKQVTVYYFGLAASDNQATPIW